MKRMIYKALSRDRLTIENTRIVGLPLIYARKDSRIFISGSTINSGHLGNALSTGARSVIRTLSEQSEIQLVGVGLSGSVVVARKKISIGKGTLVGEGCLITDSDHHYLGLDPAISRNDPSHIKSNEITIGKNVFIGARSIILKGVTIPDGAIIGAGSVVRN